MEIGISIFALLSKGIVAPNHMRLGLSDRPASAPRSPGFHCLDFVSSHRWTSQPLLSG